ncbi:MAG: EamA family transporter [Chloroflexota bacterium]
MTATSSFPLIGLAVIFGVIGQLALKMGMTRVGAITGASLGQPIQVALQVLSTPLVLGGLAFYALGAAAWLGVLSRVPLSLAYPLLAVSYAITPVVAWMTLGETMPLMRWAGIGVICIGVFMVSRS